MKRKIVQHGSSSLTVTLPIKWALKYHLKKGDELSCEEQGPRIIIETEKESHHLRKEVSTTFSGIFTKNNLTQLYQLGYDEVEVRYDDLATLREIQERVPECIGYEIIDQKAKVIVIKSIASALESEFDVLLRKCFLVTKEMGEDVYQAIVKNDFAKLEEIRHQEFINNKFTMCCVRILHKRGFHDNHRIMQMYDIIKQLERIADEYKYICDAFHTATKPCSKESIQLFKNVNDYFEGFYQIFYKFDPVKKNKIYMDRKSIQTTARKIMQSSKAEETLLMHHLRNIIEKTYDAAGEYFALIL